jgi:hypothetical protein
MMGGSKHLDADQIVKIMALLQQHCTTEYAGVEKRSVYAKGWSDGRIAEEVGCTNAQVAHKRSPKYGPLYLRGDKKQPKLGGKAKPAPPEFAHDIPLLLEIQKKVNENLARTRRTERTINNIIKVLRYEKPASELRPIDVNVDPPAEVPQPLKKSTKG